MSNSEFKNPVLVIGGTVNSFKIASEFGKRGIDVYIVTDQQKDFSLNSKYLKERIIVSRPWDCQFLKKLLIGIAKTTAKRPVVYPITDMDALNLSIVKDELRDDYYFVVGERKACETLVNKRKFYQTLSKTSIKYPATFFPQDLASAKRIGKDLNYPVFIRPSITQLFSKAFGLSGLSKGFIANSYRELLNYYHLAASKKIEVMFQEIISGPPNNSFQIEGYFNKEFCSNSLFARQRLRIWPPDFGNTTLCVSVPMSELAFESNQIAHFMKNIRYNGLASAEFKKDPRDGRCKLLEINARPWLHFWLSAECGVNILLSSYLDAIGEKTESKQVYAIGLKSIDLEKDILASAKMFQKRKLGFLEWISSLKGVKQLDKFDKNDAFAFFAHYLKRLTMFYRNRLLVLHSSRDAN